MTTKVIIRFESQGEDVTDDVERLVKEFDALAASEAKLEKAAKQANRELAKGKVSLKNVQVATKGAIQSLDNFITPLKLIGGAVAGAGVLGAVTLGISNMNKTLLDQAGAIGLEVEALSGLRFAFEQNDIAASEVDGVLGRLTGKMRDALSPTSEVGRVFSDLGVAVTNADGTLRDVDAVLLDVADSFQELGPGTERTAAALKLFEETGPKFVATLGQGSKGMQELIEKGEKLGAVIGEEQAQRTAALSEQMKDLKAALTGVGQFVAEVFVPGLTEAALLLTDLAAGVGLVSEAQGANQRFTEKDIELSEARRKRFEDEIKELKFRIKNEQISASVTALWHEELAILELRLAGVNRRLDFHAGVTEKATETGRAQIEIIETQNSLLNDQAAIITDRVAPALIVHQSNMLEIVATTSSLLEAQAEGATDLASGVLDVTGDITGALTNMMQAFGEEGDENIQRVIRALGGFGQALQAAGQIANAVQAASAAVAESNRTRQIAQTTTHAAVATVDAVATSIATEGAGAAAGGAAFAAAAGIITAAISSVASIASLISTADEGFNAQRFLRSVGRSPGGENRLVALRDTEVVLNEQQQRSALGGPRMSFSFTPQLVVDGEVLASAVIRFGEERFMSMMQNGIDSGRIFPGGSFAEVA